ncbi:DUF6957 family protein [Pseudomonas sp. zjy_15]|uniref:DUF6957 family protein n=1 Tax=Pseudomonas sp. zjy_15 TaxID=3367265 RepID=UPI00370BC3C9
MAASLKEIMSFLYGAGDLVEGWDGDPADLVQAAQQRFPGKPFCLVRQWVWIDVVTSEGELAPAEVPPMVIFAHEVVQDSRRRFDPGHWVRTTYAVSHPGQCIFETRSTAYLLLGDGYRKEASLDVVFSLHP